MLCNRVAALQWLRALQCTRAQGAWRTAAGGAICVVVLAPPSSFILHPSSFTLHPSAPPVTPRTSSHCLPPPSTARPSAPLASSSSSAHRASRLSNWTAACACRLHRAWWVKSLSTLKGPSHAKAPHAPCAQVSLAHNKSPTQTKSHSQLAPLRRSTRSSVSPTNGAALPPRGKVGTEMNRTGGIPPASQWCKDAAPFILGLGPEHNGASVAMPGEGGGTRTLL